MKYIILLILFLSSCDLFNTRTPASPDNNQSALQPATSQDILITNFKNSLYNKNSDAYSICLADTIRKLKSFIFIPSSNGQSLFNGLFDKWNKADEIRYINNLFANISKENNPNLDLKIIEKNDFPDSTVYIFQYKLNFYLNGKSNLSIYNGQMLMSLVNNTSGQWFIQRWIDLGKQSSDTTQSDSWSILKGKYYN